MDILKVLLTSVGSVVVLFFLTKLMGKKQMSQLSIFDYIIGITIGSIAAEMATSLERNFLEPLTAMVVYGLTSYAISLITCKSIRLRRFITGKPLILYENGKLYNENFKKAKLEVNEFLAEGRNHGYFDLETVQSAILETNGKVSFIPVSSERPVTPRDLNLSPAAETPLANVIIDGKIMTHNLKFTGNNEEWLQKELQKQGIKKAADVFLATCDKKNQLSVYVKINKTRDHDIFE